MGYTVDADWFASSTERLFKIYEKQVLNAKSDISGTDEVTDAGKIVAGALEDMGAENQIR